MSFNGRVRVTIRAIVGLALALTVFLGAAPQPTTAAATWSGSYSVYTPRSFSYQHLDYTCVGASIQMMLNMQRHQTDHSVKDQNTYWRFGNEHNRYHASNNGVDPQGWVAALQNFGAGNYSINLATGFQSGLKALAERMRATGKAIGLFVHDGAHAWVMTGFKATADPQATDNYTVTSVQVMGPLYPDGTIGGKSYDPGPGTWLSLDKLRVKFTRLAWNRAPEWNGRWVAVVPN